MLNYIWAGLIVFSLVFAGVRDLKDIKNDTYRNGQALPVTITHDDGNDSKAVHVVIDPAKYHEFYKTTEMPAATYAATMSKTAKGAEIRFPADAALPYFAINLLRTYLCNSR